ncbi:MAG: hypothetical protein PHR01_01005 [Sphaerochaetaceae bacterium]|nr:hypothetical protein [Sphaerochaetaceae bacterium]
MVDKYKKALAVCKATLAGQSGHDPKDTSVCFYRLGVVLSRIGEIHQSIRCFHDAFMLRDPHPVRESEFSEFHSIQFARYILGKKKKWITTLAEGDMVHDLIKNRWHELQQDVRLSEIPFAGSDRREWFKTVTIDFPWVGSYQEVSMGIGGAFDQESYSECVEITK